MKLFKYLSVCLSLLLIIGKVQALDTSSGEFINFMTGIEKPSAPVFFRDAVIFMAPSSYRSVGIAFASENFGKIHYFDDLLIPKDHPADSKQQPTDDPKKAVMSVVTYQDSGILFYAYKIPPGAASLRYRLIINGLWTRDPLNPDLIRDSGTGLLCSHLAIPASRQELVNAQLPTPPAGILQLHYQGQAGHTVMAAGTFNNWDPFMYQLNETSPGNYSLNLPLPPGRYQYIFYDNGTRTTDGTTANKAYDENGNAVSVAVVH
jgi:hypothetical protein